METQQLMGKVALVTGGNSGIGLGAAKSLIEAGARLYNWAQALLCIIEKTLMHPLSFLGIAINGA